VALIKINGVKMDEFETDIFRVMKYFALFRVATDQKMHTKAWNCYVETLFKVLHRTMKKDSMFRRRLMREFKMKNK
jgi:hypothetical protein